MPRFHIDNRWIISINFRELRRTAVSSGWQNPNIEGCINLTAERGITMAAFSGERCDDSSLDREAKAGMLLDAEVDGHICILVAAAMVLIDQVLELKVAEGENVVTGPFPMPYRSSGGYGDQPPPGSPPRAFLLSTLVVQQGGMGILVFGVGSTTAGGGSGSGRGSFDVELGGATW